MFVTAHRTARSSASPRWMTASGTKAATTAATGPTPQKASSTMGCGTDCAPGPAPLPRWSVSCLTAATARSASSLVRCRGTNTPGWTLNRKPAKSTHPTICSRGSPDTRRATSPSSLGAEPATAVAEPSTTGAEPVKSVATAASRRITASSSAKTQPAARSVSTVCGKRRSARASMSSLGSKPLVCQASGGREDLVAVPVEARSGCDLTVVGEQQRVVGCQRYDSGEFDSGVAHRLVEVRGLGADSQADTFEA